MKTVLSKILLGVFILMTSNIFSQIVSGNVSSDTGNLPGASVSVKGTTIGTQTDFDGNYQLNMVDTDAILVFSYLGYKSQEIEVNGRSIINIKLEEDSNQLDEVVILAYGQSQNKRLLTSSIATVKSEQIQLLPISQAEAALQGTVPGVVVQQNSGSPGSPQTVRVRGVGTPNNSSPLYIVDGVQVPNLSFLNPNDIVSQTVLKDATSTAIYGSRGGNGVILVETLRGKKTPTKPEITIQSFYGIQSLASKPNLMNRDQYVQYYNEGVAASSGSMVTGFRGAFTDVERNLLPNTDWYDVLFNDTPVKNVYASVIGGGEKISYAVSGGLFGQEGILGGKNKSEFNRRNIRTALDIDITNRLNFSGTAQYQNQDRYSIAENNGAPGSGISSFINALPPIYPAYDDDGNFFNPFIQNGTPTINGVPLNSLGAVTNPLFSIAASDTQRVEDVLNLSFALNWEPIDNLKIKGTYGSFNNFSFTRNFFPLIVQPTQQFDTSIGVAYQEGSSRAINRQYGATAEFSFRKLAEKKHNLNTLLGYEVVQTGFYGGATIRNQGAYLTNNFDEVNFALSVDNSNATLIPGRSTEIGMESFFGKLDYNYSEKYLLSLVIRKDKSSNFGADNKNAWFPAVSAGWILSEEDFLANSEIINFIKIRGSWGISGNDLSARPLAYLSSVSTNASYAGQPGIVLTGLANPNLGWEELNQYNIGLDIYAFDNKLGLTLDYYNKETTDILLNGPGTPLTSGLTPSIQNIGAVENSGLEVGLSYRDDYDSGFGWNIYANASLNKNQVTDLGETSFIASAQIQPQFNDFASRTQVGHPIASFYGYVVEGIDANGNLLFQDINNSGNNRLFPDSGDKTIIGDPNPDVTFGLNFGMHYKGFDINTFMSGTAGNDILDATIRYDANGTNRPAAYITESGVPRNIAVSNSQNGEQLISDFHIKDGSFLRIKNISLGFNFPEDALKAMGAKQARVYVSGQNLFTFTKYTGMDPEIGQNNINSPLNIGIDQGFFPQARQFLLGFNFKF